jgi:hypothetical protein
MVTTMNMAIPTIKTPPTTDNPSCLRRNTPEAFFPARKKPPPPEGNEGFSVNPVMFFSRIFPGIWGR